MKKYVRKKQMIGLCTIICAGMLLFTGCAGTETKTETEKMEVETITQDDPKDETVVDDGKKAQEQDTFADGNDMISSADLAGPASGCSDAGCMINSSSFASVDDDGASSSVDGVSARIVFADETIFQKGTVKSDGSSYSLENIEKSGLKDNDFILCFGNQQEDGTYLADRIIVITFN